MELLFIAIIVALATFTQAVTGFGLALVSMPLLVGMIGIRQAAPLIALVGIASQLIMIARYRQRVVWGDIRELAVGSVIGIPLGVLALTTINETLVTLILGLVILAYVAYALTAANRPPPRLKGGPVAYGAGLTGGLLTGAYNSGGPPLVIYGSARRWSPLTFKGNIQALLVVHSITAIISHSVAGNMTRSVLELFAVMVPVLVMATLAGFVLDQVINPRRFHQLVLLLLTVLGLRLILGVLT